MADKGAYTGKITHGGTQIVKAPNLGQPKKGKGTVKKGTDLRQK
jgi:hypothetical protein